MSTEQFLSERYVSLIQISFEKGDLTETMKSQLLEQDRETLEELEQCFAELQDAIEKKDMYRLIDRIEKGNLLLDKETDMTKREQYTKRLKELGEQLDKYLSKPA